MAVAAFLLISHNFGQTAASSRTLSCCELRRRSHLKSAVCTSRAVSAAHTPGLAAVTTHIGFVALLAADMRAFAARGRSTALLRTKDPEATTTGRDQLAVGARLQSILLVPPFLHHTVTMESLAAQKKGCRQQAWRGNLGLGSAEATRAEAKIAILAGTGRLGAPLPDGRAPVTSAWHHRPETMIYLAKESVAIGIRTKTPQ